MSNFKNISVCISVALLAGCTTVPSGPATIAEVGAKSAKEANAIFNRPINGELGIYDVYANVLTFNRDIHTKNLERDIALGKQLFTSLDYLPEVSATLNDRDRDRLLLTTSARLGEAPIDGVDTIPSFSSPLDVQDDGLRIQYNLINIAKTYLLSKVRGNEVQIAEANRERAAQNVFRDVLPAYYFQALDQKEGIELRNLNMRLKANLDQTCSKLANKSIPLNQKLSDTCDSALSTHSTVVGALNSIEEGTHNFAALLTVRDPKFIKVKQPVYSDPGELVATDEQLVDFALSNRPELFVEIYRGRNAKLDKGIAWVDALPGIELGYERNSTDNPFIVNDSWEVKSLDLTFNLIGNIIKTPFRLKQADKDFDLANARYRALVVTIGTQAKISLSGYNSARQRWINSYQRYVIANRSRASSFSKFKNGEISPIEHENNEIQYLLKRIQAHSDYVRMTDWMAKMYQAIGVSVTPSLDKSTSVAHLATLLKKRLEDLSLVHPEGV